MKKGLLVICIGVLGILNLSSCYAARIDGPYKGRVIDAETRQPIEGAVVLGVWNREIITPGGATNQFYEAKETVTDKNGEFEIEGLGLLVLSNVIPMDVLIFKAGYEYLGPMPWISLKVDILLTKKVKWEEDKAIIPLRKLTVQERWEKGTPSFPTEAYEKKKMPLLAKELNKEEEALGRKPYLEEWR